MKLLRCINSLRVKKPKIILQDGSEYTGEWVGSRLDGYGILISEDKSRYEGNWFNDK